MGYPLNDTIEIGGPVRSILSELGQVYFTLGQDKRKVVSSLEVRYFRAVPSDQSFVPGPDARIGPIDLKIWITSFNKLNLSNN